MTQIFDLIPTNGRKSFGGKAKVRQENNVSELISFNTIVARYFHETNKVDIYGYFSPTTIQHQNAFLTFYGFDTMTKKEIENSPKN
jgi:hypothetical protein